LSTSAKPVLFISIVSILLFGGVILLNMVTKLNCEKLTKDIVIAQEKLEAKKNTRIKLQAELQNWCSEEKISEAAKSMDLIKMTESAVVLNVEKSKIEQVEKIITGVNE
jgi:cell division protein FtsL